MLHSPLKTALAYECFQDQASSTLALPSDHKLKTKGTGKQRVQEQVMMTVKRQKQKSSVSSSVGHSNRGTVPTGVGAAAVGAPPVSFCGVWFVGDRAVRSSRGVPSWGMLGSLGWDGRAVVCRWMQCLSTVGLNCSMSPWLWDVSVRCSYPCSPRLQSWSSCLQLCLLLLCKSPVLQLCPSLYADRASSIAAMPAHRTQT